MNKEFIYDSEFFKNWFALGLTEDDMIELEDYIEKNPDKGDIIQGTGGIRKLRWSLSGMGKRGGARILYIEFIAYEKLYFLDIYTKNEKENLSEAEKNNLKKLVKALADTLGRRSR